MVSRLGNFISHAGRLMLDYDFENSVGYWVFATAHALSCHQEELAAHGITSRQWEVLAYISHDGELSQSELAERMHIDADLGRRARSHGARDGWIVHITDDNDRRRKLIRPTPAPKKNRRAWWLADWPFARPCHAWFERGRVAQSTGRDAEDHVREHAAW